MTSIIITVERGEDEDWRELDVEVTGTVTRYRPATRLDPEEGGEVEIASIMCEGEVFELTPKELTKANELLENQARSDAAEARYARAELERDSRIDGF